MSFADGIREELLALPLKRPCCKRAISNGLLSSATVRGDLTVLICKGEDVAFFAADLLRRQFGKTITPVADSSHGRGAYRLEFASQKALSFLRRAQSLDMETAEVDACLELSCETCRSAFLRGLFLACGTVNDPRKSFHMELHVPAETERAISAYLESCGYPPRRIERVGAVGLYYKNGTAVEELVTLMGAAKSAMEIINIRIEREIRNQENRATNCVAKNIEKSVSAASRQMLAIEKLTLSGMLAQMPEGIRMTALLRAENPDATLEELRMLHDPPITKSGLNHRLNKLIDEADKL